MEVLSSQDPTSSCVNDDCLCYSLWMCTVSHPAHSLETKKLFILSSNIFHLFALLFPPFFPFISACRCIFRFIACSFSPEELFRLPAAINYTFDAKWLSSTSHIDTDYPDHFNMRCIAKWMIYSRIWVDATIVGRINTKWGKRKENGKSGWRNKVWVHRLYPVPCTLHAILIPLEIVSASHFLIYSWNDWSFFFGPVWLTMRSFSVFVVDAWTLC